MRACLALLTLAFLTGCSGDKPLTDKSKSARDEPKLTPVELALNWYPEAEHGGYYAALVHGYYKDLGLDVKIIKGGPSAPVFQRVARGDVQFGISNADGLLEARAQGVPIVALLAPLQISPRCIMVHEKSGIKKFSDLKNMTIAMSQSQAFYDYLCEHAPLANVTVVPYQGTVAQFLVDDNYAQQAYVFSEPFVAQQKGGDPKSLMLSDLGFNPYTSMLIASESYIKAHPEIVGKVVAASARGWRQYLKEPDKTNRYIHDINEEMSLEALEYGVRALTPLVLGKDNSIQSDSDHPIGPMTLDRWKKLAYQLVEIGRLPTESADAQSAFTNEFLPEQ